MTDWGNKFGINSYAYTQSMSALDFVRHLVEHGADMLELMLYPGHLWITDSAQTLRNLRLTIETNSLSLATLNSPNIDLNIAAATEEMRAHSVELNLRYIRLAAELGAAGLILAPGKANPLFPLSYSKLERHFFKALDMLLPEAEKHGIEILLENQCFAFLPDANGLMEAIDRYGNDSIGVCYDVANAHFVGEDPANGLKRISSRLKLVHLSDTTRTIYRHDPISYGDVDFARLAPAIAAAQLDWPLVLEIISGNPDADIADSIDRLAAMGY